MSSKPQIIECDVAVIGGGLGGVAAALAAAEGGAQVVLTEETSWIGGQVTSQAVSALDEHPLIEEISNTWRYAEFRNLVRQYYQEEFSAPPLMPDGAPLNPGNGWVSRLCFEPRVGLQVLQGMLSPFETSGALQVIRHCRPVACRGDSTHLQAVQLDTPGRTIEVRARQFIDATELGDLLPLAGVPYVTGAEAFEDTGEPHASRDGPHPERIQSFTFCFLVEFRKGENHLIRKPRGYERFKESQPYSLVLRGHHGELRQFYFLKSTPESPLPFWTYRRLFDASLLAPGSDRGDIALINWASNDYRWGSIIDQPSEHIAATLDEARRLSLGFLYWLQTEAPRDEGGFGYPELKLLPSAVGTRSGLAMAPYIREARRIIGLRRILEQDISAECNPGKKQAAFPDSVGIGWYSIDLHPSVGDETTLYTPTLPFQIPLGALIPRECDNLLAGCKNISATHISNGAFRLHPVEWSIGEAAGSLAAECALNHKTPSAIWHDSVLLGEFQALLVSQGMRLDWQDHE